MPRITFLPADVTVEVPDGATLFSAAARAEVPIPSQCGGRCACALCKVKVVGGPDRLSPMRWDEEGHMGNAFYLTGERLSCQARVYGDVTVEIESATVREKVRGRYIPYSLIRKREQLEEEEELRRVRTADGAQPVRRPAESRQGRRRPDGRERGAPGGPPGEAPDQGPAGGRQEGRPEGHGEGRPEGRPEGRSRRRRHRRNPGAARPGDSLPPPAAGSRPQPEPQDQASGGRDEGGAAERGGG